MTTPLRRVGMTLAAHAGRRVGPAQRHALVDGHVVLDLGGLADDRETVVDEEARADGRAGMDVDRGHEPREVIDEAGEEIEPAAVEPVRHAVHAERDHARIEQHFPTRPGGGIARLDRVEIGQEIGSQAPRLRMF